MPQAQPIGWSSTLQALLVSVLWGGNVVALKYGLATFPPYWSAFWRMLAGLGVLAAFALASGISLRQSRREAKLLFVLGLLFFGQIALMNLGTDLTSPAYAVVLLNSHPLFANLVGHFVDPGDRLRPIRVLGLSLAFAGIVWVALGRPQQALASDPFLGNLLLIASAILLGIRAVYTRWLVQDIDPVRAIVWQVFWTVPLFLLLAPIFEPPLLQPLNTPAIAAILYQSVIVAGICFIIWTRLLQRHSAGTLSVFGFTVPIFGVVMSWWIFDEPISARILLGMAAVTIGIVLVTRAPGVVSVRK